MRMDFIYGMQSSEEEDDGYDIDGFQIEYGSEDDLFIKQAEIEDAHEEEPAWDSQA